MTTCLNADFVSFSVNDDECFDCDEEDCRCSAKQVVAAIDWALDDTFDTYFPAYLDAHIVCD